MTAKAGDGSGYDHAASSERLPPTVTVKYRAAPLNSQNELRAVTTSAPGRMSSGGM